MSEEIPSVELSHSLMTSYIDELYRLTPTETPMLEKMRQTFIARGDPWHNQRIFQTHFTRREKAGRVLRRKWRHLRRLRLVDTADWIRREDCEE